MGLGDLILSAVGHIMSYIVSILASVLPAMDWGSTILVSVAAAVDFLIDMIEGAGYFLPISSMIEVITYIIIIDNWHRLFAIAQKIIGLVRG